MTEQKTHNQKRRRPVRGRRRGRRRSHAASHPVPLNKRTSSHFEPSERQRGVEALRAGHVRMQIEGTRLRAYVQGREQPFYPVGLDWSEVMPDRVLHAFCGCRRFAGGKPCKHIWAALLALTESGEENQPSGRDRLSLRKDRASAWPDLNGHGGADFPIVSASHSGNGREAQGHAATARAMQNRQAKGRAATVRAKTTRVKTGLRRRTPPGPHDRVAGAVSWRSQLAEIREASEGFPMASSPPRRKTAGAVRFAVNTEASLETGRIVLDLFERRSGNSRKPVKPRRASLDPGELEEMLSVSAPVQIPEADFAPVVERPADLPPDDDPFSDDSIPFPPPPPGPAPQAPLAVIAAMPADVRRGRRGAKAPPVKVRRFQLPPQLYLSILPHLCDRDALAQWDGHAAESVRPLAWDVGRPLQLALRLEITTSGTGRLRGRLERNGDRVSLSSASLILPVTEGDGKTPGTSLVFLSDKVARLDVVRDRDLPWIRLLQEEQEIIIPKKDLEEALITFLELPSLPRFEVPEELRLTEDRSESHPKLVLEPDSGPDWLNPQLLADLSFLYDGLEVNAGDPRAAIVDWEGRRFLRRDADLEHAALVKLLELGFQPMAAGQSHGLEIDPRELAYVAEPLLRDGWVVEAHGHSLRPPSPASIKVESGIDWFELSGSLDFEGDEIELKKILEAVSRGERFVELEDGSRGLLPAAYVETYDSLSQLAHSSSDDGLRFLPSQALLVDTLLTALPPANVDKAFADLRTKLRSFESIKPKKELKAFQGELRGYQREGLGWLDFLREFGLGGVLADDMGLGKTVQVLALILAHRTPAKTTKLPFLVVAPRSLVYNWKDEAARFTPKLKVVEYGGPDREKLQAELNDYDLVVTTYGTMRRDIGFLAKTEFDTIILDEAQAIKNPASQTARASSLLVARHRLALTGTPIENHLGELGSIFEVLNPGLLGRLPKLDVLASGRAASGHQLEQVARGIRPFILRRTKAQVLPDLPPKTEQVLLCTLGERQQEIYDQIRATYQASLLPQVEKKGVSSSSIQVLEALLRLRQVACHPGLVNEEWDDAGSTKLEALFEQVSEVLSEGHKVIVFSQFTKLLAYVRGHLDQRHVEYAYLDGQTRNRGEIVEYFQNEDSCNLFLISLKAGGFGLNLTAADYVFLLDPWWNPAVEAQAIDRAHRIGQTQPVFAYRMIAQGTVEEKILDLQRSKRQIADAILEGGEGQSLRDLTADDLRMLLS